MKHEADGFEAGLGEVVGRLHGADPHLLVDRHWRCFQFQRLVASSIVNCTLP